MAMARPNNASAIRAHVQGLREAKAAFQALPDIVREEMLAATEMTVREIARNAQARIRSSPSIRTRALHDHIAWQVTKTNGRGRVGVASARTSVSILSERRTVKVKGVIVSRLSRGGRILSRLVNPARYAHVVEFGARHMNAEPFMLPSAEAERQPALARYKAAGPRIERQVANIGRRNL